MKSDLVMINRSMAMQILLILKDQLEYLRAEAGGNASQTIVDLELLVFMLEEKMA